MKCSRLGICFRILLTAIILIFAAGSIVAGDVWRHNPAFYKSIVRMIDTPERCYMLLHGEYFNRMQSGCDRPSVSLFALDRSPESVPAYVEGNDHGVRLAEYNPYRGYLMVVYESCSIDMFYDDGSVINIGGFRDINIPYDLSVRALTFDPERNYAYLTTSSGFVVIDDLGLKVEKVVIAGRDLDVVAVSGDYTYALSSRRLLASRLDPVEIAGIGDFYPVNVVCCNGNMDACETALAECDRLLPIAGGVAVLSTSSKVGHYSLSGIFPTDNGEWVAAGLGEYELLLAGQNTYVNDRLEMNAMRDSSGWMFDTPDSIVRLDAGIVPSLGDADGIISALGEYASRVVTEVEKPEKGRPAASWSDANLIDFNSPAGFDIYERAGSGGWNLVREALRPDAPLAGICENMVWHPRYGVLAVNRGNGLEQTNTGVIYPSSLSAYSKGEWLRYQQHIDYPRFATDPRYESSWNWEAARDRYPVTMPRGLAVDPDDDRFVYVGSWFYGIARYDLDDPGAPILHMAQKGNSNARYPGFAEIAPRLSSWADMCCFTDPSFDSDGTLWSAYYDLDARAYGEGFQLWYWPLEARRQAADAAENPGLVKGWGRLVVKDVAFHGNGRLLALRHESNRNLIVAYSNMYNAPIIIYDHNGTLEDTSDDRMVALPFIVGESGEEVSKVRIYDIDEDPKTGRVWIGADVGCFSMVVPEMFTTNRVYVPRVEVFGGEKNDGKPFEAACVSAIAFGVDGCVWIGTSGSGLYCLSADGHEIIGHWTTVNSGLPSDFINGIVYNRDNSSVMISTRFGISELFSDGVPAENSLVSASVVPDHVPADYHGWIRFNGLPNGVSLILVDENGRNIAELGCASAGCLQWDITDGSGQRPATGRYYVFNPATGQRVASFTLML